MWKHIDRNIVEKKYGGTLENMTGPYWPPSQRLMNYVSAKPQGKLLTKQEYNEVYRNGKLNGRKVKQSLIEAPPALPEVIPNK